MRKIIMLIHVSLDGFAAPHDGSLDWITYTKELENYSYSLHDSTDAAIYGGVTYEGMKSYWPTVLTDPNSDAGSLSHARWAEAATKIVISKTLTESDWANTIFIGDNIAEEINKIKAQPGKNIWLLGSPSIARLFMQLNLIDEYRINVNPSLLGGGVPLFGELESIRPLKLLEARVMDGGVVALRYEPA